MNSSSRIFCTLIGSFGVLLACSATSPNSQNNHEEDPEESGSGGSEIGDGDLFGDGDIPIDMEPPTANCGDGTLDRDEACDDGNEVSGDGCGDNCRYIEQGFVCPKEGEPCRPFAKCGDGKIVFPEQCDDGGVEEGDGCSEICKIEIGWKCDQESPSTCAPTVCGDGAQEGAETCEADDGMPFDGCSIECQAEPQCTNDGCSSTCGDGLVLAPETCDDGNAVSGDGCSSECQVEDGYECKQAPLCAEGDEECALELPIVFRDFNASHPDFHDPDPLGSQDRECDGSAPGIAKDTLDERRKPVFNSAPTGSCVSAETFPQWYGAAEGEYATIVSQVALYPNGEGGYVNRLGPDGAPFRQMIDEEQTSNLICEEAGCCEELGYADQPWECCEANDSTCLPCTYNTTAGCAQTFLPLDGNPLFFPLDDHPDALEDTRYPAKIPAQFYGAVTWPWEDAVSCEEPLEPCAGPKHNFHFTSEIAYWFEYTQDTQANLTFIGDDDVFVFVNGRLVIDLGGIHVPIGGRLSLRGGGRVQLRTWIPPENEGGMVEELSTAMLEDSELGLTPGGVYEIKVFHAERKPEGSSFQLTLSGFNSARSECTAICGDGILAAGEQCDNGKENNTGGHNGCNADCTLGSYCGDGILQEEAGEVCDDNAPDAPSNCQGCRILEIR